MYNDVAKIQRMKQVVPKNEKKRRKEVLQEIEQLECSLKGKHDQELKEFEANQPKKDEPKEKSILELQLEAMKLQICQDSSANDDSKDERVSKTQRRREKKEREERERHERVAQDEQEGANHIRKLEQDQLNKKLRVRSLILLILLIKHLIQM